MIIKRFRHQVILMLGIALALSGALAMVPGHAGEATPLDATVQHLIAHVAGSDLVFIRNAGRYTGQQASEHMLKKYRHFRDRIKTPEEFIDLCASRSLLSGKPYRVVDAQGRETMTRTWLLAELQAYRNGAPGPDQ